MITPNKTSEHVLTNFEHELQEEILKCKTLHLEKGDVVIRQEAYVRSFPLLIKGSLRVYRKAEDRELLLYYVNPGQTCTMSLAACFEQKPFHVEVAAVDSGEVILIPGLKVTEWQRTYPSWNDFIIKAFSARHDQLLKSLDSIAFAKMDQRIKNYLHQLYGESQNPVITITHQELANELGTTRVVISRILKCLELEGAVDLLRGAIKVKNLKLN